MPKAASPKKISALSLRFLIQHISFSLLLTGSCIPLKAQEYETDRIFMNRQKRSHCLIQVRKHAETTKNIRVMTHEHVLYLNRDIWNREKGSIKLSKSQLTRKQNLLEGKSYPKYLSFREIQLKKKKDIVLMKKECVNPPSQ